MKYQFRSHPIGILRTAHSIKQCQLHPKNIPSMSEIINVDCRIKKTISVVTTRPNRGLDFLCCSRISGARLNAKTPLLPQAYVQITEGSDDIVTPFSFNHDPFAQLFSQLMKDHHIYKEELADRTVLDVRTIERMMAEMTFKEQRRGAQRNLRTIIACGVGMHLKPHTTMKLIELGGYKLREYLPLHRAYLRIIDEFYNYSVAACNEYLVKHGFSALTKNESIVSYDQSLRLSKRIGRAS